MALSTILGNIVFGTVGFVIVRAKQKVNRMTYLVKVAFCLWGFAFSNVFFGSTVASWMMSILLIFVMMGIGGGISFLFAPRPTRTRPLRTE
jgi:hypothetical protein